MKFAEISLLFCLNIYNNHYNGINTGLTTNLILCSLVNQKKKSKRPQQADAEQVV